MKKLHEILNKLSVKKLIWGIVSLAMISFAAGLWIVFYFQSKNITNQNILEAVYKAEKLVQIDPLINFERAMKIYEIDQTFALFNTNCNSVYNNDLMIIEDLCRTRDKKFTWVQIERSSGDDLILGYKAHFDFLSFILANLFILITVSVTYLIFITVITCLFFRTFLHLPIQQMTNTVDGLLQNKKIKPIDLSSSLNPIVSKLYESIQKVVSETVRLGINEEKLEISRQIVHDLRAPLSILENSDDTKVSKMSLEYLAIKRIKQISDSLLSKELVHDRTGIELQELISELEVMYPELIFEKSFDKSFTPKIALKLQEIELYRFLSNLLKNAIEAQATKVQISCSISDFFLYINLKDNGSGMEEINISSVVNGHTTKSDGHGLGISSINSKLQSIQGEMIIRTTKNEGFEIALKIPLAEITEYVLIDDDKLIRINWDNVSKEKNVKLTSFADVHAFLIVAKNFSPATFIYIDSSLKDGVKGEMEAKKIFDEGFQNIYLATGYSSEDFNLQDLPWIKGITSKRPPF